MKKIKLNQNRYALVDDEDYNELNQYSWYCRNNNYAARTDKFKKTIQMHRVIMNPSDSLQIDHINGNGFDNRKENLRICTRSQNLGNSKISKNSKSGVKGVSWYKPSKKWRAQICVDSKVKNLGYFLDINKAKDSYTEAAKAHFGEFYSDGIRK